MVDMLVNLLTLPPAAERIETLRGQGVVLRRANTFEQTPVRQFIQTNFGLGWADEVLPAYANKPVSLYLALRQGRIIGFGAYECVRRAFFGPTGVAKPERHQGIGTALLLACLQGLADMGYAYAIIGGTGSPEFYRRTVGATEIPNSTPGIYADPLQP